MDGGLIRKIMDCRAKFEPLLMAAAKFNDLGIVRVDYDEDKQG